MKFYKLSGAKFYDCINSIYQFIKPYLDGKMSIFVKCGAFKQHLISNQKNAVVKMSKKYPNHRT